MAICPFAVQQIIPESYTQGRITPTTLIFHRAVSSAESLQGYWNTPGVELESHFHIGQFGTLYQFMDTGIRADANVDANGFAISVESWDGGNTPDDMPWNPAQLATAKRLAAWVCETHGVKRGAAQTWNGGGIGGHNWFPYPWAGGPRGCPGTARNAQIRNDIIPYVAAGGGWRTPVEDDMNEAQNNALTAVFEADVGITLEQLRAGKKPRFQQHLDFVVEELTRRVNTRFDDLSNRVGRLETTGIPVTVDYQALAAALADEQDRRARDNDHTTGPTT